MSDRAVQNSLKKKVDTEMNHPNRGRIHTIIIPCIVSKTLQVYVRGDTYDLSLHFSSVSSPCTSPNHRLL